MNIEKEQFEDAGELDEHGLCDYYYAGDTYQISFDGVAFVVRRYENTPDEAAFLQYRVRERGRWKSRKFHLVPYDSLEFQKAIAYLVESEASARFQSCWAITCLSNSLVWHSERWADDSNARCGW